MNFNKKKELFTRFNCMVSEKDHSKIYFAQEKNIRNDFIIITIHIELMDQKDMRKKIFTEGLTKKIFTEGLTKKIFTEGLTKKISNKRLSFYIFSD
jgi:hypothetical protein